MIVVAAIAPAAAVLVGLHGGSAADRSDRVPAALGTLMLLGVGAFWVATATSV